MRVVALGCDEFRAHLGKFMEHEIRRSLDRQPDRHSVAFGSIECKRDTEKQRLAGKQGKALIF